MRKYYCACTQELKRDGLDKNDKKAIRNALLSFFCCIVVAFRVDNDKITI